MSGAGFEAERREVVAKDRIVGLEITLRLAERSERAAATEPDIVVRLVLVEYATGEHDRSRRSRSEKEVMLSF